MIRAHFTVQLEPPWEIFFPSWGHYTQFLLPVLRRFFPDSTVPFFHPPTCCSSCLLPQSSTGQELPPPSPAGTLPSEGPRFRRDQVDFARYSKLPFLVRLIFFSTPSSSLLSSRGLFLLLKKLVFVLCTPFFL